MLIPVNFEEYKFDFKKEGEVIYIKDIVRKKWIKITPEEWIRQNVLHYLIFTHNYPINLVAVEKGIATFERKKRFDIVVYNEELKPYVLVECKNDHISFDQKTATQLLTYNATLQCTYFIWTNGKQMLIANVNNGTFENTVPLYSTTKKPSD